MLALEWLQGYVAELGGLLIDPRKRASIVYLASALLIAMAWGALHSSARGAGWREGARRFLSRKTWLSPSSLGDFKLFALNQAVMMAISPWLASRLALTTLLFFGLHDLFGGRPRLDAGLPPWLITAAFTVTVFLLDDAATYWVHRALHRVPLLWSFHKVHHSAETLTPFTVYRTHPLEGVLFSLQRTAGQAVAVAGFVFFFGEQVSLVSVLGANVFLFAFNLLGANLRHSHVPLSYGRRLEHLFISPLQHQIHHSVERRHYDCNFGAALAVWDWMGGTLRPVAGERDLRFGLAGGSGPRPHRLSSFYWTPFVEACRHLRLAAILGVDSMIEAVSKARASRAGRGISMLVVLLLGAAGIAKAGHAEELNVYSHRQPFLIEPFLAAFTAESGIAVNVVYSEKGLAQRLEAEGEHSPADVVLTVDIGWLWVYADKDLLAPVSSEILTANVPAHLRDPQNRWFGLSKRARAVAIAKGRVERGEIERIEDLADPKWRGRICSRPGSHVYNRALLSSLIAANGEEAAEAWARGLVENLAQRPQGNDRAQVKAIFQGVCDVAIINNYYYGKLASSDVPEHREWAEAVELVFTNQNDRGNHVNISGAGVAKHSKHKAAAVRFIEFLSEPRAQRLYTEVNYEYPVNPEVGMGAELASWGEFVEDEVAIARIAELGPTAQRIIDRVGW